MSTSFTANNNHHDEEAPLLGSEQPETCEQQWRRFKREHRAHFGISWAIVMLITAFITYFVNRHEAFAPDVCISDRSRPAAIMLSVFFGSLGADRIYLGYVVYGILKLFTGGLAGIWWVIDLTLLVMNVLPDTNGCRLE